MRNENKRLRHCALVPALVLALSGGAAVAAGDGEPPPQAKAHWDKAQELAAHEDWPGAIREINALIAIVPDQPGVYAQRAYFHKHLQHWKEELADFNKAIALYGDDPDVEPVLEERAELLSFGFGQGEAALRDIDRAIAIAPKRAEPRYTRTLLLFARGDMAGALAEIDRTIALDAEPEAYHQMRGMLLAAKGDLAGAQAELDLCVRKEPQNPLAWSIRAELELESGDVKAARDDARRALSLMPSHDRDRLTGALADVFLGDVEAAATALREVAAKSPSDLAEHVPVAGQAPGEILERIGKDGARAAKAQLAWGMICAARGDASEAEGHFAQSQKIDSALADQIALARAAFSRH